MGTSPLSNNPKNVDFQYRNNVFFGISELFYSLISNKFRKKFQIVIYNKWKNFKNRITQKKVLLKVYITQKMIIIFFNEFVSKFFQLCDNSIFFTFSKIYVINTLCDKAILACVIGKSCCVIQQFTLYL